MKKYNVENIVVPKDYEMLKKIYEDKELLVLQDSSGKKWLVDKKSWNGEAYAGTSGKEEAEILEIIEMDPVTDQGKLVGYEFK